jgi:hypothetical protein
MSFDYSVYQIFHYSSIITVTFVNMVTFVVRFTFAIMVKVVLVLLWLL